MEIIEQIQEKKRVLVYTEPDCPWCERVKEFMDENGVEFTELNIKENDKAGFDLIEKTGYLAVPVVDIDGEVIIGYDAVYLKDALGIY